MKDMTKGSPIRLILGFAIPLLLGMLFQQFYNLVDMIIVGRFLGSSALAAVGSTGSINFMILGFCMGVCNGFAIPPVFPFQLPSGLEQKTKNNCVIMWQIASGCLLFLPWL